VATLLDGADRQRWPGRRRGRQDRQGAGWTSGLPARGPAGL